MESNAGRGIEIQVAVVHAVQAPQRTDLVHRHVLRPHGEVEGDDRHHRGEPARRRDIIEQSPAVHAGEQRRADRRRRQQPQERRVDDDQARD